MDRWRKMKNVREKLEKIFYGAGGKPENLKKSILTGRGNRDKAVAQNGLGSISEDTIDGLNEDMPLNKLLGQEIYHSENIEGMEGLNGFEGLAGFGMNGDLGSATAASVAAASTVLTTIAGMIKTIGSLFPKKENKKIRTKLGKKNKQGGDEGAGSDSGGDSDSGSDSGSDNSSDNSSGSDNSSNKSAADDSGSGSTDPGSGNTSSGGSGGGSGSSGQDDSSSDSGDDKNSGDENSDDKKDDGSDDEGTNGSANKSLATTGDNKPVVKAETLAKAKEFWENNKKWIKPAGIAVGSLGLIYLAYRILKPKSSKNNALSLQGIGKKKKTKPKANKKDLLKGLKKKGGSKATAKKKKIALI
jgi:hypothetical protein